MSASSRASASPMRPRRRRSRPRCSTCRGWPSGPASRSMNSRSSRADGRARASPWMTSRKRSTNWRSRCRTIARRSPPRARAETRRVGDAIEARLGSVLASVELAELGRWVGGLERLDRTHPDWLTLIESLTINDTFLFRDWAQLELLRTSGLAPLIAAAGRSAHPALRLWSAGCASGEEAYSLAVLALEALAGAGAATETAQEIELKASWSLDVLGTDISRPMLIQARNGLYST